MEDILTSAALEIPVTTAQMNRSNDSLLEYQEKNTEVNKFYLPVSTKKENSTTTQKKTIQNMILDTFRFKFITSHQVFRVDADVCLYPRVFVFHNLFKFMWKEAVITGFFLFLVFFFSEISKLTDIHLYYYLSIY